MPCGLRPCSSIREGGWSQPSQMMPPQDVRHPRHKQLLENRLEPDEQMGDAMAVCLL